MKQEKRRRTQYLFNVLGRRYSLMVRYPAGGHAHWKKFTPAQVLADVNAMIANAWSGPMTIVDELNSFTPEDYERL